MADCEPSGIALVCPPLTFYSSILDGRTGFRILEGRAVMFAFVAPDELVHWAKMELPKLPELQEEVKRIETNYKTIGVNFTFVERRIGGVNSG